MRYLLAVVLILGCTAGSATAAAGPPQKPALVETLDVVIQRTDDAGNPVGPPQTLHDPQGRPDFADEQAAKGDPNRRLAGTARVTEDWGSPSYSGCAWIHAWLTERDILGFVVYKYHVRRNWCWNYGHRETSVSTQTPWFTDLDPNFIIIDVSVSPHGWFYTWCCGDGRSGHYAFRQGEIQNCILKYGCIGTWYPTVEIFVHGNGTAYVRRSGY
jgi:hypothetical protein